MGADAADSVEPEAQPRRGLWRDGADHCWNERRRRRHFDLWRRKGRAQRRSLWTVSLPQIAAPTWMAAGIRFPTSAARRLAGLFKLNVRPSEGRQISLSALTQNDQFANNGTSTEGARFNDNVTTGAYTLGYTYRAPSTPLIDFSSHVYYTTTQNRQTFVAPTPKASIPRWASSPATRLRTRSTATGSTSTTRRAWPRAHCRGRRHTGMGVHLRRRQRLYLCADAFRKPFALRAYVQDEISYSSWLRVLGALREDGYHLSGGGVSSGGTHLSPKLTIGIARFAESNSTALMLKAIARHRSLRR